MLPFKNLPKISFKRVVQAIKSPTFIGFSIVSAALTLYLYWTSGSEGIEKTLLAVTSICLEGLKLYSLLTGNIYGDYVKLTAQEKGCTVKELLKKDLVAKSVKRTSRGMYAIYVLAASVSIFGSFNFTITAMDRTVRASQAAMSSVQSPEMVKLTSEIKYFDKEILRLQGRIDQNTADWKSYGPDMQTIKDRIQRKIDADVTQQADYEKKRNADDLSLAQLQASTAAKTADIKKTSFEIISEQLSTDKIQVTPQGILGVLMIVTSLLIELGIIVTSPHEDTFGVYRKVSEHTETPLNTPPAEKDEVVSLPKLKKMAFKKSYKKRATIPAEPNTDAVERAVQKAVEIDPPRPDAILSKIIIEPSLPFSEEIEEEKPTEVISEEAAAEKLESQPEFKETPKRVEVKSSPVFSFLKSILPEDGMPGFIRKENIGSISEVSPIQAKEIFNNLARAKGHSGFPVFEFRKDHGKWYSNYPLNEIVEMFSKGSLYI